MIRAESIRVMHPLFHTGQGGSTPTSALQLRFGKCEPCSAVAMVRAYHSRLPRCQAGPWMYAFEAEHDGIRYAAALWNNPSARCLPGHWIELRRMVCVDDAPRYTASRFLAWMVRWIAKYHPEHERAISYQDTAVHKGTIYKACGWSAAQTTTARVRDRSKNRIGTNRAYRSNINGVQCDAGAKVRWEKTVR